MLDLENISCPFARDFEKKKRGGLEIVTTTR
jgi:hypothetical protein